MRYNQLIHINAHRVSINDPTYFIADVASNHDGDLARAKNLMWKAKESGADAVKFQHFKASKIVSDVGFKAIGRMTHQKGWQKSVYEMYEACELNRAWNEDLASTAKQANIDFMTSPYDVEAVARMAPLVSAFKIGSGEITWTEALGEIARQGKPVILATGASTMEDVERALAAILPHNGDFVLMQCNTNYTGDHENFRYVNLRVLQTFATRWPGMILGLSDHTPGHAAVLGAVALGARMVEKHFTDDNGRMGPDHSFSMTPCTWREMVDRTREIEAALGDGVKRIEANEQEPVLVQRRSLRFTRPMKPSESICVDDLEPLRPAPKGSIEPFRLCEVVGRRLVTAKEKGDAIYWADLESKDA